MKYLIDTHTFLWFDSGSRSLSSKAQNIISSEQNEIYLSTASLWEISIKSALGKLDIVGDYAQVIDDVVNNNGTIESLQQQVDTLHQQYLTLSASNTSN